MVSVVAAEVAVTVTEEEAEEEIEVAATVTAEEEEEVIEVAVTVMTTIETICQVLKRSLECIRRMAC